MDYGVSYSILVNGNNAAAELTKFVNVANNVIPRANKQFDSLNAKLNTTLKRLSNLKRELSLINKTKVTINTSDAIRDLSVIQRRLDRIKSKSINVSVNERVAGSGARRSASGGFFGGGKQSALGRSFNTTSMLSAGGIPFATTIGAGLIGLGLRSVIGDAIEFQNVMLSAMNVLKADDKDLTSFAGRFETMSKNMRQLGVDTKFTAVDIAGAVKLLAMAGMNLETVDTSMKAITNLATIGDSDLPKMADIMTNIMNGYGIAAKDMNKAADIMAVVSNQTNVDVVDVGEAMNYAASYMRMASVDFNEGTAAIGLLGNAGIKASRAGTSMRAMLIRMISPTTKAQKVIDRLGVSFTQMTTIDGKQKEVLRPLHAIFSDLKASGATMEDLVQIFDKIGGGAALALTDNAAKLKEFTDNTKNAGGIADFLAEEKMKTVLGLSQQLKSKLMDLGQTMFDKLSPQIEKMMSDLLGWMKSDDAAVAFETITNGISSILSGMKDIAVFVNNNWGWLKFIFGGMVIGKVGSGIGSLLGGTLGHIRGLISGATALGGALISPVASMRGLISGGSAAATAVGGVGASLGAFAVGGAVAGGLAVIAYKLFQIYETGKRFSEIKDTLSDWSMKSTGMNFESIDLLQKKLNDIRQTGQLINIEKTQFGQGIGDQAWISGVNAYNKQTGDWFTKLTGIGQQTTNNNLWDIAGRAAYGGKEAKSANEMFLAAISGDGSTRISALSNLAEMASTQIPSRTSDRLYSAMAYGQKLPTDYGAMENILTGSAPYIANVRKIADTKKRQAERFLAEMQRGGRYGAMGGLNVLLGGTVDIPSIMKTIQTRKTTSPEDLQAILRASGTSVAAMRSALQVQGVPSAMIDNLLKQSGFGDLISTGISTTTSIAKMTTAGEEEDGLSGGGAYSGTGKMKSNQGKMIIVNIDSLLRVDKASFVSEADREYLKDQMSQILMDVVKDFEIGYN